MKNRNIIEDKQLGGSLLVKIPELIILLNIKKYTHCKKWPISAALYF